MPGAKAVADQSEETAGFEAIIGASALQSALDSVSTLVDECKLRLNEDGLRVRAVDPANVGMVDLTIGQGDFESYHAAGGVTGVNLNRISSVVTMASGDDLVYLALDADTRTLSIEFDGLDYTLALIDPDAIRSEPDIPDLDLSAEVWVEGSALDRGVTAADLVSEHIRLSVDAADETFHISAEGDTDDVDLEFGADDAIDLTAGAADSLFSLDYVKDMNKAIPAAAEVHIEVGEEFPVKLHYDLGEDTSVTYMLAPRIQG